MMIKINAFFLYFLRYLMAATQLLTTQSDIQSGSQIMVAFLNYINIS